ncbi:hypothetical protein CRYUN_Cryun06bG0028100 [Craigia yunnanensis]
MDDEELDFLNQEVFSGNNMGDIPSCCSMDSIVNEFNYSMILMFASIHTLATHLALITLIHTPVSMFIPKLCLPQLKIRLLVMTPLGLGRRIRRNVLWVIERLLGSIGRRLKHDLPRWRMRL